MTTQTIKEKVNKYGCKPVGDVCMKHERPLITFGICEDSPELRDFIDSVIKEREEEIIDILNNTGLRLDTDTGKMNFINLIKYKNENTKS